MTKRLVDSPTGRVMIASRENENRATMIGFNTFWFKLIAFVAAGVFAATTAMLDVMPDKSRMIFSCGGGMPPGVSTANVNAFIDAVRQYPGSKG